MIARAGKKTLGLGKKKDILMEQRETSRILTNVMDWKLEDSQINDKFSS